MKRYIIILVFLFSCDDITNITEVVEMPEPFKITLHKADTTNSPYIFALGNYEYYLSHYTWSSAWDNSKWSYIQIEAIFVPEDTLWMSRLGASQIKFYGTQNEKDFVQHLWVMP